MSNPSLTHLSNRNLTRSLQRLVSDERRRLVEILEHLNEFERRKLHLASGFRSLYDYCVNGLHYSRSAADRRIVAARALRRFPEVAGILTSGDASLTTVSMIARLITPTNGHVMLKRIRGKSQRQVERIVDEYRPEIRTRDRVRTVSVRERVAARVEPRESARITPSVGGAESTPDPPVPCSIPSRVAASIPPDTSAEDALPGTGEPPLVVMVQKHEIRFIADKSFMNKLQRMKALLSNRTSHTTFEQVFDAAMECYLERHCPERRHERRRAREENMRKTNLRGAKRQKTAGATTKRDSGNGRNDGNGRINRNDRNDGNDRNDSIDRNNENERNDGDDQSNGNARNNGDGPATDVKARSVSKSLPAPGVEPSRQVPRAVRDSVFARDEGRCAFAGPGGRRCGTRRHLHIDHIVPYAHGGTHEPENLRLLCRAHNLLAAERAFGRDVMLRYMRRE